MGFNSGFKVLNSIFKAFLRKTSLKGPK